jgi:hypothetical protein
MSKIKMRVNGDAFEKAGGPNEFKLIPSHVRQLDGGGQRTNGALKEVEACKFRSFVTALIKRLQAEAHAKKGHATFDGIEKRRPERALVECTDEGGVVADPGKKKRFGIRNALRRTGALRGGAETLQSPLDTRDITRAIVNERDVHKRPLVLGRTLRRRLSRETAKRRARANALNMASTW